MTSPDFDELARLWTQEQSPEEERIFQQLARRAGRRAKAKQEAEKLEKGRAWIEAGPRPLQAVA